MVGTAALLDHNAAIVSPDDHGILGFRPITSRTYFAARLANVLVYTTIMTTLFAYLPIVSFFLRWGAGDRIGGDRRRVRRVDDRGAHDGGDVRVAAAGDWPGAAQARAVVRPAAASASSCTAGISSCRGWCPKARSPASRCRRRSGSCCCRRPGSPAIWKSRPAATSPLEHIAGRGVRGGADRAGRDAGRPPVAGLCRTARRDRIGDERGRRSKPARSRRAWLFTTGEARAVALLIRSQFKNDMKFRMGVLAILPLTVIYLFMGISERGHDRRSVRPGADRRRAFAWSRSRC